MTQSGDDQRRDDQSEAERRIREAALDRTIEDSFPASDPPSTNPDPYDRTARERRHSPATA
jgi:hypothetical protein